MKLHLIFIIYFVHHGVCMKTDTFEYQCESYEKDEQALQSSYGGLLCFYCKKNVKTL